MPTPLVLLFYVWLVVSLVVLVRRVVLRRKIPKTPMAPRAPVMTTPPSPPSPASTAPPVAQAAATPPPTVPDAAGRMVSLMEALTGISLPVDLLPLTLVEGRTLGDREVLLITAGHTPEAVGLAMREELARLGYQVTPMAGNNSGAVRDSVQIRVTVHARPDTMLVGKRPAFPTAAANNVVVELTL